MKAYSSVVGLELKLGYIVGFRFELGAYGGVYGFGELHFGAFDSCSGARGTLHLHLLLQSHHHLHLISVTCGV